MSADDPSRRLAARWLQSVGKLYARAFHDVRILSPCTLPPRGKAILVCNHTSGLDPVLIQSACSRLVVWMMAREYYDIAALKWGFDLIEAIPVDRSGKDLAATRAALRALQNDRVLGVFPEGRIERDRSLLPFHSGVAMMAHRSAADVYPAYLDGSQRGKKMGQAFAESQVVRLIFGPKVPLDFSQRRPDLRASTERIRQAVESLQASAASI